MRQISRSEVTSLCDAEIDRVPVTDFDIACARKKNWSRWKLARFHGNCETRNSFLKLLSRNAQSGISPTLLLMQI